MPSITAIENVTLDGVGDHDDRRPDGDLPSDRRMTRYRSVSINGTGRCS